jgi:hypothetical protein
MRSLVWLGACAASLVAVNASSSQLIPGLSIDSAAAVAGRKPAPVGVCATVVMTGDLA